MIYYFSATGNSAWVAQKLALQTGDTAVDMRDFLKTGEIAPSPAEGERLGLVFPVHAWRPPSCVLIFVKNCKFLVILCLCGLTMGKQPKYHCFSAKSSLSTGIFRADAK